MNSQHLVPLRARDTVFGPAWGLSCIRSVYEHVFGDLELPVIGWAHAIMDIGVRRDQMEKQHANAKLRVS